MKKPVFVAGVGVPVRAKTNTEHAEKEWIVDKYKNFFSNESVKFIHARDDQSGSWIANKCSPNVEVDVAPDLICSLTLPNALKSDNEKILGVVTRKRPKLDAPDDYSELGKLCKHAQSKGYKIRHIILGSERVGKLDFANSDDLEVSLKEVIYTESLTELTRAIGECDHFASMKFHGTVVATMYGVPSIVMIPTNKNRNFMKRIGLDAQLSKYDSPDLIEKFDLLPARLSTDTVHLLNRQTTDLFKKLRKAIIDEYSLDAKV